MQASKQRATRPPLHKRSTIEKKLLHCIHTCCLHRNLVRCMVAMQGRPLLWQGWSSTAPGPGYAINQGHDIR